MNALEAGLARIAATADKAGISWAIVGGFAISVRVEPRFTRDIDLAITVADDNAAEAILAGLNGSGYRVVAAVEQDAVGRLAIARMRDSRDPDGDLIVDLLFASSGIEPEIVAAADRVEVLPGLMMPVAVIGHLIAVKLLARDDQTRPQDAADLVALREEASEEDMAIARVAVELIMERGFNRDRDLREALAEFENSR